MLAGGCSCGFVRYEANGPVWHETLCHCASCRRAAGAPAVAWFTVRRDALRFGKDEPTRYQSSPGVARGFCPRCGTPLTFEHDELPDEVDVTVGSLDHPETVPPRDHTWTAARLPWLGPDDDLPHYEGARPRP